MDTNTLQEKLRKLTVSQQSIEIVSQWCLFYKKDFKRIVSIWYGEFVKANKQRQMAMLYLANDIIQNSRKKGPEFTGEFYKYLPKVVIQLTRGGDAKIKKDVSRLFDVWHERRVFGNSGIPELMKETKFKSISSKPVAQAEEKIVEEESEKLIVSKKLLRQIDEETKKLRTLESQQAEALHKAGTDGSSYDSVMKDYESSLQLLIQMNQKFSSFLNEWKIAIDKTSQEHANTLEEVRLKAKLKSTPAVDGSQDSKQDTSLDSLLQNALKNMSQAEREKISAEISKYSSQPKEQPLKRLKTDSK